jgi:hypothetical protein
MKTLNARDLQNDTLPQAIVLARGRARIELNDDEPIQLSMRLSVPNFGEIYCYADNEGRGYRKSAQLDFVAECAKTRVYRVREAYEKFAPAVGAEIEVADRLGRAITILRNKKLSTSQSYEALAQALHAGEKLALHNARTRIARLGEPRKSFMFGALSSRVEDPVVAARFKEVNNFATSGWYWWKPENAPDNDRVDYTRMDSSINWCWDNKIVPKGFGYLYMTPRRNPTVDAPRRSHHASHVACVFATDHGNLNPPQHRPESQSPRFNDRWSYDRIKKTYQTIIKQTMYRYHPKLQYAEIMNEAHDKANLWGMTHEQILDMAKMAFRAARDGSSIVKRQMNHCCMWGEYAKRRNADGSRRWTPFRFVKDCFDNGIDYEVIGLQLYYPQNDIFEIDRMLERFAVFNKPCHITESPPPARTASTPTPCARARTPPAGTAPGPQPCKPTGWNRSTHCSTANPTSNASAGGTSPTPRKILALRRYARRKQPAQRILPTLEEAPTTMGGRTQRPRLINVQERLEHESTRIEHESSRIDQRQILPCLHS